MKILITTGALVGAVMVAGCGGGDGGGSAAEPAVSSPSTTSATPTPTPTPSPTTSSSPAVPQVSERTTCDLLFNSSGKSSLDVIVDFITRPVNNQKQAHAMDLAIQDLQTIAESASDHLAAQLNAEATAAQMIYDGAMAGSNESYDTTALRAAGLEIANTCQDLLG